MRAIVFASRSLIRQPGRTALAIFGIAAVGALLFDMLLLSRGLLVSFRDVLGAAGFDVRVTGGEPPVTTGPRMARARALVSAVQALPAVDEVVAIRFGRAQAARPDGKPLEVFLTGADPVRRRPWVVLDGHDVGALPAGGDASLVINRNLAR